MQTWAGRCVLWSSGYLFYPPDLWKKIEQLKLPGGKKKSLSSFLPRILPIEVIF